MDLSAGVSHALLDRDLQRSLLHRLALKYPDVLDERGLTDLGTPADLVRAIAYLTELGLADASFVRPLSGGTLLNTVKITAKGLDFLQDDGGLTALLGVVTVRLHDDTVRDLLLQSVDASAEDESTKANLKRAIRQLPAEATKEGTLHLLRLGAAQTPDVIQWIRTLTGL
ncbi:hypothetical protein [Limimaricola sp.]|uniref:hypothetical protein n=1 Tax=Limimaricola sp. TaxID=2211665 RepID=UPI004059F16F